jgi:hypothetical protein
MQRRRVRSKWIEEQWEAVGIVQDPQSPGSAPSAIVQRDDLTQMLFPGHHLQLARDEAEGYYLNLTSPEPKVFVLWREVAGVAEPKLLTVSYGEGARWADSGEQVDGVPLPPDLAAWVAEFVETHYRPEPPQRKRYASNRDRGRMGHIDEVKVKREE